MWDKYAKCPCGFITQAPFGNKFHIHMEVCPHCGKPKSEWKVKTMRWVSEGRFLRPRTWGKGHWDEK